MTGFGRAIRSLEEARVAYRIRKPQAGGELDLWISQKDMRAAEPAILRAGFFPFEAPGLGEHRFFLSFEPASGAWLKLDVKLEVGTALRRGRVTSALARRRPLAARRLGPVIAVLGPDGAGKGTMISGIGELCPVAVTQVYLGRRKRPASGAILREERPSLASRVLPQSALLIWKALRDLRRLLPAYTAAWRGHIVLCDRHPIEVLAVLPDRSPTARRVERFIARHLIPWPDLILLLDAPTGQLRQRKREHPKEVLDRWRRGYVDAFVPRGAVVISTAGSREQSLRHASRAVWLALGSRRRWRPLS